LLLLLLLLLLLPVLRGDPLLSFPGIGRERFSWFLFASHLCRSAAKGGGGGGEQAAQRLGRTVMVVRGEATPQKTDVRRSQRAARLSSFYTMLDRDVKLTFFESWASIHGCLNSTTVSFVEPLAVLSLTMVEDQRRERSGVGWKKGPVNRSPCFCRFSALEF
jgi:hypothetical protein